MSKKKKKAAEEKEKVVKEAGSESLEEVDKIEQIKLNTDDEAQEDKKEPEKAEKEEAPKNKVPERDTSDDKGKAEDKTDDKAEDKTDDKADDKADDKVEDKVEDDDDEEEDDGIASNGKVFFGVLSIIILLAILSAGGLGLYFLVLNPVYEKEISAHEVSYPQLATNLDAYAGEKIFILDSVATLTDATFVPTKRKETSEEITTTEEATTEEEWYDPDTTGWDDSEYNEYDSDGYEDSGDYEDDYSEYDE